jgi:hypothetical protein
MKKLVKTISLKMIIVFSVAAVVGLASTAAQADITWNFTNAADYWVNNAVVNAAPGGGSAYVPARLYNPDDPDDVAYGSDWAAVFAKVNTQAPGLKVGDITGGGFTLTGFYTPSPQTPDLVYGSLYLYGSGPHVLINLSPMGITGSDGNLTYTFGLSTEANVLIDSTGSGDWVYASGYHQFYNDFSDAIDWVENSTSSGNYAAYFGPQIGMSGTSETTFTVTQIKLVPEPGTLVLLSLAGLSGLAMVWIRRRRLSG